MLRKKTLWGFLPCLGVARNFRDGGSFFLYAVASSRGIVAPLLFGS